jgi:hypothetical protein
MFLSVNRTAQSYGVIPELNIVLGRRVATGSSADSGGGGLDQRVAEAERPALCRRRRETAENRTDSGADSEIPTAAAVQFDDSVHCFEHELVVLAAVRLEHAHKVAGAGYLRPQAHRPVDRPNGRRGAERADAA